MFEGVMCSDKKQTITAIRRKNGEFEYFYLEKKTPNWVNILKHFPFLRDTAALIESSAIGSKHLSFAVQHDEENPNGPKGTPSTEKKESELQMWLGAAVIGVISLLFAKFLVTIIPIFLAQSLRFLVPSSAGQVILESIFKLILLLGYLVIISQIPLIKRVFFYHCAEHKVTNYYEKGLALTTENVPRESRLHYRCSSSFILFTIMVSMLIYFLVPATRFGLELLTEYCLFQSFWGSF